MITSGSRAAAGLPRDNSSPWHSGCCKLISLVGELGRFTLGLIGELGRIFSFLCSGARVGAMERSVVFHDVYGGLLKSLSFGLIITWICCYKGFQAPRMATGVGQATTESVVMSFVLILVSDYFMTSVPL